MNNFIIKGNICFSTSGKELKTLLGYAVCKAVCKDGKCAGVFNKIPAEFKTYELYNYGDMQNVQISEVYDFRKEKYINTAKQTLMQFIRAKSTEESEDERA